MSDTDTKRRRYGPSPIDASLKRVHSVNIRLNGSELAELDRARGRYRRAAWLRMSSIGKMPPTIPGINRESWAKLATVIANLNQYQAAINANMVYDRKSEPIPYELLNNLLEQVQALRLDLIHIEDGDDE